VIVELSHRQRRITVKGFEKESEAVEQLTLFPRPIRVPFHLYQDLMKRPLSEWFKLAMQALDEQDEVLANRCLRPVFEFNEYKDINVFPATLKDYEEAALWLRIIGDSGFYDVPEQLFPRLNKFSQQVLKYTIEHRPPEVKARMDQALFDFFQGNWEEPLSLKIKHAKDRKERRKRHPKVIPFRT